MVACMYGIRWWALVAVQGIGASNSVQCQGLPAEMKYETILALASCNIRSYLLARTRALLQPGAGRRVGLPVCGCVRLCLLSSLPMSTARRRKPAHSTLRQPSYTLISHTKLCGRLSKAHIRPSAIHCQQQVRVQAGQP